MRHARIYQPPKSAMQSGRANVQSWVLEYEPDRKHPQEPLMGWTTCYDTQDQIRLRFATREDAVGYAERHGISYEVFEKRPRRFRAQAYSDNFRYDRREPWTH
jgi:hypothetical protein